MPDNRAADVYGAMDNWTMNDRAMDNWTMADRPVDNWTVDDRPVTAECRPMGGHVGRRMPAAFSVLVMLSQSQARDRER
jgi:hypothetical protein